MAVRNNFTPGEVLAAADLNDTFGSKVDYALPVDTESGTTYTFTLANANQLVTATNAAAKTFTIPPQSSVVWLANSTIRVVNYGAGALTIAGGAGVTVTNATKTLAQFESAALIRTGSDAWTLVPFSGGVGNANFTNTATGTYSSGGFNYKFITFTGNGSLVIDRAGLCDVLVVGSGGGGGSNATGSAAGGGAGAGGHVYEQNFYLLTGSYTITVGGGGAQNTVGNESKIDNLIAVGGGGGGQGNSAVSGGNGASGGGCNAFAVNAGRSVSASQGNNGGKNSGSSDAGGGGGASAAGAGGVNAPGAGGAGTANSITGTSITRSGGGGGGGAFGRAGGAGGAGGGGAGANAGQSGNAGTANTGGGGGGAYSDTNASGGAGGSGVVIVRVVV